MLRHRILELRLETAEIYKVLQKNQNTLLTCHRFWLYSSAFLGLKINYDQCFSTSAKNQSLQHVFQELLLSHFHLLSPSWSYSSGPELDGKSKVPRSAKTTKADFYKVPRRDRDNIVDMNKQQNLRYHSNPQWNRCAPPCNSWLHQLALSFPRNPNLCLIPNRFFLDENIWYTLYLCILWPKFPIHLWPKIHFFERGRENAINNKNCKKYGLNRGTEHNVWMISKIAINSFKCLQ